MIWLIWHPYTIFAVIFTATFSYTAPCWLGVWVAALLQTFPCFQVLINTHFVHNFKLWCPLYELNTLQMCESVIPPSLLNCTSWEWVTVANLSGNHLLVVPPPWHFCAVALGAFIPCSLEERETNLSPQAPPCPGPLPGSGLHNRKLGIPS